MNWFPRKNVQWLIWLACLWSVYAANSVQARAQVRDRVARVLNSFVDVRAGAAEAYLSKGRIYLGELVTIRGKRGEEWVQVVSGKVRGWIPVRTVSILSHEALEKMRTKVDPGRDRRLRDYQYDLAGRRKTGEHFTGSGEGTDTPNLEVLIDTSDLGLTVALGSGLGQIKRRFQSNAAPQSFLRELRFEPQTLATYFGIGWHIFESWGLRIDIFDQRFAETSLTISTRDGPQSLSIPLDAQDLSLNGYYEAMFDSIGLRILIGAHWLRFGFKSVRPTPLGLSTSTLGLTSGLAIGYRSKAFESWLSGRYEFPFLHNQSPISSGPHDVGMYGALLDARWWFLDQWGLGLVSHYSSRQSDYSGSNAHVDTLSGVDQSYGYTTARDSDMVWSLILCGYWRSQ
ncbi:MAG: SH3 domain-containing protein [Myxococcota bacterium]|nr:SH3 domain-containing protein [Myxococcota bacterium]